MVALVDLTGQTFGELLVLRRGPDQQRPNGKGHRTTWTCQCSCGQTTDVVADKLRRKKNPQRTCGHTQAFNDLSGRVFERLAVTPDRFRRTEHGVEWFCQCSCGRASGWHRSDHLLSGAVTQCEWCKRELTRRARLIDLTGLTFGRLTVVRRESDEWGQRVPRWLCQCACGNPELVSIAGGKLRGGQQSCGCLAGGWDSAGRFLQEPDHARQMTTFYFVEVRKTFQKFGIADDPIKRSRNNGDGNDYSRWHLLRELPRAEAWAAEQICLLRTKEQWQPAKIRACGMSGWPGWTELRYGLDPVKGVAMAEELLAEAVEFGWVKLLERHAPLLLPPDDATP